MKKVDYQIIEYDKTDVDCRTKCSKDAACAAFEFVTASKECQHWFTDNKTLLSAAAQGKHGIKGVVPAGSAATDYKCGLKASNQKPTADEIVELGLKLENSQDYKVADEKLKAMVSAKTILVGTTGIELEYKCCYWESDWTNSMFTGFVHYIAYTDDEVINCNNPLYISEIYEG